MREEITKIQMGERVFVNTFVNNAASSMAGPSGKPSVDNDDGDALRFFVITLPLFEKKTMYSYDTASPPARKNMRISEARTSNGVQKHDGV